MFSRVQSFILFSSVVVIFAIAIIVYQFNISTTGNTHGFCGTIMPNDIKLNIKDSISFARGKSLFQYNCASCHSMYKKSTGPAMIGSIERWQDTNLLKEFIRNPQKVIKKSLYAKKIVEEYSPVMMTSFTYLSDDELNAIFEYINAHGNALASVTKRKKEFLTLSNLPLTRNQQIQVGIFQIETLT